MFKYSTIESENQLTVNLEGDLDIDCTEIIKDELIPILLNYKQIKINFESVPFVDSSGIGLLIELVQTIQEKSIEVEINKVSENISEVFEMLQLSEILGEEIFN